MKPELKAIAETLNGAQIVRRYKDTIIIRLPRALWRPIGRCDCSVCRGHEGFWDALAIRATKDTSRFLDTAWTVHCPDGSPVPA